jgi:DNA-binding CsgD family transcriptional regulator
VPALKSRISGRRQPIRRVNPPVEWSARSGLGWKGPVKTINLITRDNGVGLTTDMDLLESVLVPAGYEVRRVEYNSRTMAACDLAIFLELFNANLVRFAHRTVGIFNLEWFASGWERYLRNFDQLWAKSLEAQRVYDQMGLDSEYTGFLTRDLHDPAIAKADECFHLRGHSGLKNTEAVIEGLTDALIAAAPAILDGVGAADGEASDMPTGSGSRADTVAHGDRHEWPQHPGSFIVAAASGTGVSEGQLFSVGEYAKAVLYNSLGHYRAAREAAERARAHDFGLLEGVLVELVEASVRSGNRATAGEALRQLEARAQIKQSAWSMGLAACARALLEDDEHAEDSYLTALEWLDGTRARVALGRVRLLFGEWLRHRGRCEHAQQQLTRAHDVFSEVGLGEFAERARRELLAMAHTARKRTDKRWLDLSTQEAQIAGFAAAGCTNREIGERLFISPRTVEWHLRKVFTKLGISSRRELKGILSHAAYGAVPA